MKNWFAHVFLDIYFLFGFSLLKCARDGLSLFNIQLWLLMVKDHFGDIGFFWNSWTLIQFWYLWLILEGKFCNIDADLQGLKLEYGGCLP